MPRTPTLAALFAVAVVGCGNPEAAHRFHVRDGDARPGIVREAEASEAVEASEDASAEHWAARSRSPSATPRRSSQPRAAEVKPFDHDAFREAIWKQAAPELDAVPGLVSVDVFFKPAFDAGFLAGRVAYQLMVDRGELDASLEPLRTNSYREFRNGAWENAAREIPGLDPGSARDIWKPAFDAGFGAGTASSVCAEDPEACGF